MLRGVVMVLMALDHTRDFWGRSTGGLTNAARTTVPLFFTRWITHFCAPVFVFLAGTAAFLYGRAGRSRADVSRFLLTRGLWLVVLELTVVRFAWTFDPTYTFTMLQVIWAIGWSMVVLGILVWLPLPVVVAIGLAMVAGHNAFDRPDALAHSAPPGWIRSILHESSPHYIGRHVAGRGPFDGSGRMVYVAYPLVPWLGVIALGYGFGAWFDREPASRARRTLWLGLALTIAFVVLRAINHYGDPSPWHAQRRAGYVVLSFLDCEKYPPSLDYLLMTIGPALCALAWFDRGLASRAVARPFVVFGRVPLFYYVAHLFLLHLASLAVASARLGWSDPIRTLRASWGLGYRLPLVYAIWIVAIIALYPACAWFADIKRRRRDWWLSYL